MSEPSGLNGALTSETVASLEHAGAKLEPVYEEVIEIPGEYATLSPVLVPELPTQYCVPVRQ